jgi:hypothetical protein
VKTAISVPEQTFERAERYAQELGISRSEFYSRAAARYLDDLDAESVTRQINDTLAGLGEGGDASWTDAVETGRQVLADVAGEW